MKKLSDNNFKRDIVKLVCLFVVIVATVGVFVVTPTLSTPTLLSIVLAMLFSPMVVALERRGYPRWVSIAIIFATIGVAATYGGFVGIQSGQREWKSFIEKEPEYFKATVSRLQTVEAKWKTKYPILQSLNPTQKLVRGVEQSTQWLVNSGPALMGEMLTLLFLVPILTFVLLKDGRSIKKRFFELVPNRYFESVFSVTTEIMTALADYIRAKLVEAFLVGLMCTVAFAIVGAPYAIVLGVIAGVTNILPYVGPFIGAVPGLMVAAFDSTHPGLFVPVVMIYLIANIVDTVFIFPVVVAKLVDLHPLILIVIVMVGQQYYGLIGMLISIPIATALKVIIQKVYSAVYQQRADNIAVNR